MFITFKLYLTQRAICGSRRAVGDIVNCKCPMVIKNGDCQTIKNDLKLINILKINQA